MKKLISCILIFALLCSLSVSAFAKLSTGENAGAQLKLIANSFGMLRQPDGKDPWYYAVTDLDHNGRLELLACRKDSETGDGYVRGWELTPDGQRLEALHTPFENESANPDYFFNIITDSADAYYDAAKNVWFYIFTNNLLVDMPEYDLNMLSTFTCGLSMINGMLYDGYLGSKVVTTTGGQTTVSYSGQDEKELTEAEFLNLANTSFAGYQRSSISFDWFPASAATNLSRFADSYAVFSGDRTGVQERVNLTAPNVPNTASYVTPLVITKNPTNEQRYVGETAWFVANATGYNSLYWTLVSPWGQEYSIAEIRSQFPGASISGESTTTLTINGLFVGLNGWGAYCTFSNGVQSARTTTAYVYVYEKTSSVKNTNSNDYYNWYGLSDEELYDLALTALVLDDSDWALVQDTSYYDPWEEALAEAAWSDYFDMLWDVQDYGYGSYGGWNNYGTTLCPNCYSEVPSGVAVCPYCGSYVW